MTITRRRVGMRGMGKDALCGVPGSVIVAASLVFNASAVNAADLTTYTFAAVPLGVATSDRKIIVAVSTRAVGAFPPSVNIAGVQATLLSTDPLGATAAQGVALFGADVPTGTSGSIVVVWAGPATRCGLGVWSLYNALSKTPTNLQLGGSSSQSSTATLTVPNNGVALGYAMSSSGAGSTWTGLTKQFDETLESTLTHSGAGAAFTTGGAIAVTQMFATAGAAYNKVFASWAPSS